MEKFYAYVIQCQATGRLYKGATQNLTKRVEAHNQGLSPYTRKYGPWKLVYYEAFDTRGEAMAREKFFKTGHGRAFIRGKLEEVTP